MRLVTQNVIWARAAGRCEYRGCNRSLIGDLISGNEDANFGFIAHIVAEKPGGPRGDPVRSPLLADDVVNLMLLCHRHHKLIDVDEIANQPEQLLIDMKEAHERRMDAVTDIDLDRASHVLRYAAKIGDHNSPVSFSNVRIAMLPERYPADGASTAIEIVGNAAQDGEDGYWTVEVASLRRQFETLVRARVVHRDIDHLSVFALAPIPLLFELGRLLGDIVPAEVYQLLREPQGWKWASDVPPLMFDFRRPVGEPDGPVALKLSISAAISDERVTAVLGKDAVIWEIALPNAGNDVMRSARDLQEFRRIARAAYAAIHAAHPKADVLHVFPAVPVSVAVEAGRVWMPKADLPMRVYDQVRERGFVERLVVQ